MKFNGLIKTAGTLAIGGAIVFTGMNWTGSDIITNATKVLGEKQANLQTFKDNEGKLITKITDLKDEIVTINSKIDELKEQVSADKTKIEGLEAQAVLDKAEISKLQTTITEKQDIIDKLTQDKIDLEKDLETANTALAAAQEANKTLTTENDALKDEVTRLQGELGEANEAAATLDAYVKGLLDIEPADISGVVGDNSETPEQ